MSAGNVARVGLLLAAVLAAAGSATSGSNDNKTAMGQNGGAQAQTPPPPQQMEGARALGLWRSTFGGVKIEADNSKGGLNTGAVQGVWVYQRSGQEVIGYFSGNLRGNVLDFRWQEPNNPPLTGAGYLVFDPQGRQYSGRWWSDRRDRIGDWNGWRQAPTQGGDQYNPQQPQPYGGQAYGSNPYGGAAYGYQQPPPQQRPQPYYPQQRPPQPYQPQPPQQPQPYYPQQQRPQPRPYYPQQPPQQPQPQPYYPQQPQQPPQSY